IRERFAELGERDLARETERAWVSTIHGFCSRVLRAHPLAAGIDPEYRVLDEADAARLAVQASEQAMEDFLGREPDPARLELVARDLLRDDDGLGERYRARFAHVLVDELQDVNPLQEELLELVAENNLFTVGDELQSIYGFRHADVGVFRRRRAQAEAAGRLESLTTNFRSAPEIVDVIDAAFADVFGEDFQPLVAAEGAAGSGEPRVDLL